MTDLLSGRNRAACALTHFCFLASLFLAAVSAQAQQPAAPQVPAPQPPAPAAQTQPAQAQPALPAATVPGGLNLNNASLIEVINLLAQSLHINYILDASVKGGSVTINTFGAVRDLDLRPLLETILRMNGLAMVQVGNIFRIIPVANIARQPIGPISENDAAKLSDDERLVLNLVFLQYVSSSEMQKILQPFMGDGAQLTNYDAANLLIVLDNSRNMRRTLELIHMFDSDTFAGQRVRPFEVTNGRPSDIARDLDDVFKAYSLSGDKSNTAIHFLALNRLNMILAVAPTPGTFAEVEKWIQRLDVPAKVTAGSIDNYVFKLKYGRAEILGGVINQLYGGCGFTSGGLYGGMAGNSAYPSTGYVGGGFGDGGGFSGRGVSPYGGASPYGTGGYGGGYGAGGGNPSGGGMQGGGFGVPCVNQSVSFTGNSGAGSGATSPAPFTGIGTAAPGAAAGTPAGSAGATDQTGSYLTQSSPYGRTSGPRIVPNPFDNTLLVQGTPQEWEQIRHLLEQLDVPPRQVLIDAKIYEVDLSGDLSFGVESFLQKAGTANSSVAAHQLLGAAGTAGINLSAGTLVGQSRQLLAFLQANETSSKTKVLSAPSVIATDSIPASITVGDSVPTVSGFANSGIEQGGTSLFASSVSNTSTGIGLNILARVNSSGVVTMVINQNVTAPIPNPLSSSNASGSNIDSPSFSQRNVSTQVTVEDGDTIAIGGIITENHTESLVGIPFLDRLPFIGFAFGQKNTTRTRTELIVFLTPRVIYGTAQMTDATEELKQKVRGLRKMIKDQ